MISRNVFVDASNMHSGGGRTLLNGFISGINDMDNFTIFIDKRYRPEIFKKNIKYIIIHNIFSRLLVSFKIKSKISKDDIVIFLGNLPPIIDFNIIKCYLFLGNRFYVDNQIKSFFLPIPIRIKIKIEKIFFHYFIKNVNKVFVQNLTMKNLCENSINNKKVEIAAFDDFIDTNFNKIKKEKKSFIYVASNIPYKNHKKLLKAFSIVNNFTKDYKLYLTIDISVKKNFSLKKYVDQQKLNVEFLAFSNRDEFLDKFKTVETLIYPSIFESYGLPLIEAKKYDLKILSSDLDFTWDLVDPDDYFNPYDEKSIARCILRSLNINNQKTKVYNPVNFVELLLN